MNDKWMSKNNLDKAYECCEKTNPDCNACPYYSSESFMKIYCNMVKVGKSKGAKTQNDKN